MCECVWCVFVCVIEFWEWVRGRMKYRETIQHWDQRFQVDDDDDDGFWHVSRTRAQTTVVAPYTTIYTTTW